MAMDNPIASLPTRLSITTYESLKNYEHISSRARARAGVCVCVCVCVCMYICMYIVTLFIAVGCKEILV